MKKYGFLQALGVSLYIGLVGLFFANAEKIVGNLDVPVGPILFLLLFSVSALICSLLVFYKPYKLFVEGKKKEALSTVISTAVWLFVLLLLTLGAIFVFK